MTGIEELSGVVRTVAAKLGPSVVAVGRSGCGVVVAGGLVATNAHNLRGPEATVVFADGRSAPASLKAADVDGDLAVLGVDTGDAAPVMWADRPAELGDVVFGVAAGGATGLRVTAGTVSSLNRPFRGPRGRRVPGSVEHTAPLARGSSGGPLADGSGRVVGINTHRLGDGFYLALPAGAELRATLESLGRGEERRRVRLGVSLVPPHAARRLRAAVGLPEADGLLVRSVEEEGPADRAGLRRGDVLTAAGGRPLRSVDDLHEALDSAEGDLAIEVLRGVEAVTVTVSPT